MSNLNVVGSDQIHGIINSVISWYVAGIKYENSDGDSENLKDAILNNIELSTIILNHSESNFIITNAQFYNDINAFKNNWNEGVVNGENLQKIVAGLFSFLGNIKGPIGKIFTSTGNIIDVC